MSMTQPAATPPKGQSSNRQLMIVLAYLGPLALIPFLLEKEDAEVQWHAKHGLVLLIAEIVLYAAIGILSVIFSFALPVIGSCLFGILWFVIVIGVLILHVVCIVKGLSGQRFLIPTVSDFANRF
jgi:uncharacterized membrane protein